MGFQKASYELGRILRAKGLSSNRDGGKVRDGLTFGFYLYEHSSFFPENMYHTIS